MTEQTSQKKCRKNERGAALVTVLMISLLLLVAGAVLLLEASMNTANVTDATAEQQAYYAAESGIQSAVNVLRGNVPPNPLINPSPSPSPNTDNRIDFKKALKLCTSNITCDCTSNACTSALDAEPRLSRWLTYNSSNPDRVTLGLTTSGTATAYNSFSGYAYKISISDPDNTANSIRFNTSGSIGGAGTAKTFPGGTTVTYVPASTTTLSVSAGAANTNFGGFTISGNGNDVIRTRFVVRINMTYPYNDVKEIRGWIEPASASSGKIKYLFDSKTFNFLGSVITIITSNNTYIAQQATSTLPARFGFELFGNASGTTALDGSMTATEPTRLLIRSTGFGPRNAKKELEAIVQKNFFNGLSSPATLLLVGGGACSVFNPGTSNVTQYSGNNVAGNDYLPPIGTTNDALLSTVQDSVDGNPPNPFNGTVIGTPSNVSGEMPLWLQSPLNLDGTIQNLKNVADSSGRLFPNATQSTPSDLCNDGSAEKGITFVNGNLEYSGDGCGILVVTGKLTLKGNFNFKGLIIVTGADGVDRSGGGTGTLQGNIVVAPYNQTNVTAATPFLCPKYNLSGGGNSTIVYDSNSYCYCRR